MLRKRKQATDEDDRETTKHSEAHASSSAGSVKSLNDLDENSIRNVRAREHGYVSQSPEVQWLRSAKRRTQQTEAEVRASPYEPSASGQEADGAISDFLCERTDSASQSVSHGSLNHGIETSFNLDGSNFDMDIFIDPYETPDPKVAKRLFDCYIETVHPFFPLVRNKITNVY
jgi:hypothetical protein